MSDVSKYRNRALDAYTYNDLIEYGHDDNKENLIPESTVKSVIDDIESDVNEIVGMLESIKGLSEIEEIKDKIEELSKYAERQYDKAIDDFVQKVKEHQYVLSDVINSKDYGMFTVGIEQIAEELKAGEK